MYCRASGDAACWVQEILNKFEIASGQKINAVKSSIFYSRNTDDQIMNEVKSTLNFNEADEDTTYLGLPNTVKRKKTAVLVYLKNQMSFRIQGCDKLLISKEGRRFY